LGDKLTSIAYSGGGSRSFSYDLAGRMLTDSFNSSAFSWTADSRLVSLTASTVNETYTYSSFGTRAKVGTRTFLRAGAGVTASVLADGDALYTPGVSEVRSSVTKYSHSGLKNMGAQTDAGTTPAVQATRTYDAFGATQGSTGSWQGPFGTAGAFGYQTEPSGLHLLGHRYYDASTSRFLTRDPIGDGGNWYGYCSNAPASLADPAGTFALQIAASIILNDLDGDWNPGPPPGVDVDANRELARRMTGVIYLEHLMFPPHFDPGEYHAKKLSWFRNMVTDGVPWDYKLHGGSEAFGNWNYGVVAHDFELSKPTALRAAGWNQTSKKRIYDREDGNWWGDPPYGDDPVDQYWIDRGYEDAKRTWYDVGK